MNLRPLTASVSRLNSLFKPKSTAVDQEMVKYATQAAQEEQTKSRRFQPLQLVLDVLQRGQYLTANMADEIEESLRTGRDLGESTAEVLKAAWQGITGERKGDWETLLFGGNIGGTSDQAGERAGWLPQNVQETLERPLIRWGQEGATGLAEGVLRPSKWIGLAANVLLDPTTYISPFTKATKGAQVAAQKYAKDVVRLTLATMGPDDFAKIGVKFSEAAGKNIDDIAKIARASKEGSRFVEKLYNEAFETALKTPAKALGEGLAPRMAKLSEIENVMEPVAGGGFRKLETSLMDRVPGLQDLVESVGQGYAGAGQRKIGSFMGKDFGVGENYPGLLKQWDMMKSKFEGTKVGHTLGEAWWSVMNRGPVGSIRKDLGFRNPYQQMLHLEQKTIEHGVHAAAELSARGIDQALSRYDDELLAKARDARLRAETWADRLGMYDGAAALPPDQMPHLGNLLDDQVFLKELGIKPEEAGKIREIWNALDTELNKWWKQEEEKTLALGLDWDKTQRLNYFPRKVGTGEVASGSLSRSGKEAGTGGGGFLNRKAMTGEQAIKNNAATFKFLMGDQLKAAWEEIPVVDGQKIGFDEFVEQWVKDRGMTEANIDLKEAIQLRAIGHAQYMGRMNMVETFRQFGVPVEEAAKVVPDLARQVQTFGEAISPAGLYRVSYPGLDNYLFDEETAKIITGLSNIITSDQSMREFASLVARGTAWWKGWVTMTPGFHARNAISNNISGFLKYGPKWFTDAKKLQESIAITAYALYPEKYMDILKETMNVSDGWIAKVLNSNVTGDFTGKEVGDYVRSTGLIGGSSQIAEEIGREGKTWNPLSSKFKGFQLSRNVGDAIESQSKVLAFLHEYEDVAQKAATGDLATRLATQKQALEYADLETKKWFLDYSDLTKFERKVMKKVIPFYSWVRKNLANQIAGLTLYTQMYSTIPKVRGAIRSDDDFDYSLLPDYMENMGYYPVGQTAAGGTILRWANIPLEDLNKIPITFGEGGPQLGAGEILNDVVAAAHPLIKTVLEMATGKDLFRQRDIKATERAPGVLQYLSNSPKAVAFLDGALRMAGFKDGAGIGVTRDGTQLEISGRLAKILENNVPVLRTLDNMLNNPEAIGEAVFPSLEKMIEDISGKKDTMSALNEIFNIVSRVGGWKFKEMQMDEEEQRKQLELLRRAEELRAEARKELPGYRVRSQQALKARQKRAARYF